VKHIVSEKLGLALDAAIEEFTLKGVLDVPKYFDRWCNKCEPLNDISTYELAGYVIEGYEYPKEVKMELAKEELEKMSNITIVQMANQLDEGLIHMSALDENMSVLEFVKNYLR